MGSKVIPNSNFLEDDLGQIPNGSSRPSPRLERYSSRAGVCRSIAQESYRQKMTIFTYKNQHRQHHYQPPPPTPDVVGILCGMTVLCGRPAAAGSFGGSFLEAECTQGKGSVESRDTPTQAKSSNPKSERTSIPLSPLELRLLSVGIHRSPRLDLGCPSARMKVSVRYAKWSVKTCAIFGI